MTNVRTRATIATTLADQLSPLIRLEIASIGAIESAAPKETDPEYVMLYHATKTSKQANVEQMNTILRAAGARGEESGGLLEPVLHLQTLALRATDRTAMLVAMRMVEETLVARYRDTLEFLEERERQMLTVVMNRATKQWMVLIAHVAQRKALDGGDSKHAALLPFPLTRYFATEADRVCMRCLLDRPGSEPAIEKEDPHTYLCAGCHEDVLTAFPPDLRVQIPRWTAAARRDRVVERALGRPEKLRAIKEVHAVLAGLPPERPALQDRPLKTPASPPHDAAYNAPATETDLERGGAGGEELAYTDLLFDYRSVRQNW